MSQIIDQVQAALQNIDRELEKYPALKQLEKQIREYCFCVAIWELPAVCELLQLMIQDTCHLALANGRVPNCMLRQLGH